MLTLKYYYIEIMKLFFFFSPNYLGIAVGKLGGSFISLAPVIL